MAKSQKEIVLKYFQNHTGELITFSTLKEKLYPRKKWGGEVPKHWKVVLAAVIWKLRQDSHYIRNVRGRGYIYSVPFGPEQKYYYNGKFQNSPVPN